MPFGFCRRRSTGRVRLGRIGAIAVRGNDRSHSAVAGDGWEWLIGPTPFYSPTSLIVTAAGSNFTGGALRLAIVYLSFGPPTS